MAEIREVEIALSNHMKVVLGWYGKETAVTLFNEANEPIADAALPPSLAASPQAPAREGVDTVSVLMMAVQDAELAFRKTRSMGDLRHPDLAKYAALQIAIKAAVVAAGGSWK